MSLFKKSNRQFRQRNLRQNSDNEDDAEVPNQSESLVNVNVSKPINRSNVLIDEDKSDDSNSNSNKNVCISDCTKIETKKKVSNKERQDRNTIKLSFEHNSDDDDNETEQEFQIKQSNYSIRLTKQIEREKRRKEKEEAKRNKNKSNKFHFDTAGMSIRKVMESRKQEIELKLQEQQTTIVLDNANVSNKQIDIDLIETSVHNDDMILDNELEDMQIEDNHGNEIKSECTDQETDVINDIDESNEDDDLGSAGPKFVFKSLRKGSIPDTETIQELKKQRKKARDYDDIKFIPLSQRKTMVFGRVEEDQDKITNPMLDSDQIKSRLIREDPNDIENCGGDDVDVDEERVDFCIDKAAAEKEKFKEAFYLAQEDDIDRLHGSADSDDELERWEREQIRKGMRYQPGQSEVQFINENVSTDAFGKTKQSKNNIPKYLINVKPAVSKQKIMDDLNENVKKLEINLESARTQMKHIEITIDSLKDSIDRKKELLLCAD